MFVKIFADVCLHVQPVDTRCTAAISNFPSDRKARQFSLCAQLKINSKSWIYKIFIGLCKSKIGTYGQTFELVSHTQKYKNQDINTNN